MRRWEQEFNERTAWALQLDKELGETKALVTRLNRELEERTAGALSLDRELQERQPPVSRLRRGRGLLKRIAAALQSR
jgi:hypothetical protein